MKTAWRKESWWSFTPSHARPAATYTLPRTHTPARYARYAPTHDAPRHDAPRHDAHGSTHPCITCPRTLVSVYPCVLYPHGKTRKNFLKTSLQNIFYLLLFSTSKQNDKTKINFKNIFTKFLKYVLIKPT